MRCDYMKFYIEFIYPGIFVSETSYQEITNEQYLHPEKITIPEHSFGFRFKEREEIEQNGEMLVGKFKNESGWYFKGERLDKKQVIMETGENSILYKNMKNNHYDYVVKTEFGQYIPVGKNDVIL